MKASKVNKKGQYGDQSKPKKSKGRDKEKSLPATNSRNALPTKENVFDILNGSEEDDEADGELSTDALQCLTDHVSICVGLTAALISDIVVFG